MNRRRIIKYDRHTCIICGAEAQYDYCCNTCYPEEVIPTGLYHLAIGYTCTWAETPTMVWPKTLWRRHPAVIKRMKQREFYEKPYNFNYPIALDGMHRDGA